MMPEAKYFGDDRSDVDLMLMYVNFRFCYWYVSYLKGFDSFLFNDNLDGIFDLDLSVNSIGMELNLGWGIDVWLDWSGLVDYTFHIRLVTLDLDPFD